jgi:hypothetical protein
VEVGTGEAFSSKRESGKGRTRMKFEKDISQEFTEKKPEFNQRDIIKRKCICGVRC